MSEELVKRLRVLHRYLHKGIARSLHEDERNAAGDAAAALAAKDAEIGRLRTMVSRYGGHFANCASWVKQNGTYRLCDCGFSRALTPPGAEP